jgi:HpcH/HpaI aldolase/citrate lyase family
MSSFGRTKIKTNPVTDKLRSGQPAMGTWLTLCSPVAAENIAHVGWDWLVVDAEHSPVGFETMVNCFRAVQLGGAVPMACVPWNDTLWIQRTLDADALAWWCRWSTLPRTLRALSADGGGVVAGRGQGDCQRTVRPEPRISTPVPTLRGVGRSTTASELRVPGYERSGS